MAFEIPNPFAWNDSFDCKNAVINEQHVSLFKLVDNLDKHRSDADALKQLLDLVVLHFKTEEDLFAAKGWSGAGAHKATHDKFVNDALGLKSIGDGEIQFIKNWLVNHIKGSDFQYIDVLKD